MARNPIMWAFGIGVLILIVGLLVPAMITSTTQDTTEAVILEENETAELTDTLQIGLDQVQTSASYTDNATVSLTNLRDYDSTQAVINDTASDTLTLSGDSITVAVDLRTSSSALLSATFAGTFGWNDGARTVMQNMDVIIVLLAILFSLALIGVRI